MLSEFLSFITLLAYMLILFLKVVLHDIKPSQNRPCATQVSKGAKIRNRYNQVPHQWDSDKLTADTTNQSQEVSPFPAGDHKSHTCINRRAQRHSKQKTEQKHKRSTKEEPPWNGQ